MGFYNVRMFSGDRYIPEDKDYERAESAKSEDAVMSQILAISDLDKLCRRCIAFVLSGTYGRNIHIWIDRAMQLGATDSDISELKFAIIDGFTETSQEKIDLQAFQLAAKIAAKEQVNKSEEKPVEQTPVSKVSEEPSPTVSEPSELHIEMPNKLQISRNDNEEAENRIKNRSEKIDSKSIVEDIQTLAHGRFFDLFSGPSIPGRKAIEKATPEQIKIYERLYREIGNDFTFCSCEPLWYCFCYGKLNFDSDGSLIRNKTNYKPDRAEIKLSLPSYHGFDSLSHFLGTMSEELDGICSGEETDGTPLAEELDHQVLYSTWADTVSTLFLNALKEKGFEGQTSYEGFTGDEIIIAADITGGVALLMLSIGEIPSRPIDVVEVEYSGKKEKFDYYLRTLSREYYNTESPVILYIKGAPSNFYKVIAPQYGKDFLDIDLFLD